LLKVARLQRWCLQDIATELTQNRGFDLIIDFASGLPTNDHIHHVVPKDTTVIYSDHDPVVVEYSQEILKDVPNVHFFQGDARRPEELLMRPEVQEILQDRENVGLCLWGVAGFLDDDGLAHAIQALYEWSGPNSCLAFQAQGGGGRPDDPTSLQVLKVYEQTGNPFYVRSMERYQELVQPWRADGEGFISLLNWHGFDQGMMNQEDLQMFGAGGANYGAYLIK
jgi:hypothetical protein